MCEVQTDTARDSSLEVSRERDHVWSSVATVVRVTRLESRHGDRPFRDPVSRTPTPRPLPVEGSLSEPLSRKPETSGRDPRVQGLYLAGVEYWLLCLGLSVSSPLQDKTQKLRVPSIGQPLVSLCTPIPTG